MYPFISIHPLSMNSYDGHYNHQVRGTVPGDILLYQRLRDHLKIVLVATPERGKITWLGGYGVHFWIGVG